MSNRKRILWVTRTAVMIALLVVSQAVTAPLGNTLVTGSIVNLILIVSAVSGGALTGVTVAFVSPIMAKLFGIGPLWGLIPFIMLGNVAIVFAWHIIVRFVKLPEHIKNIIAAICGAVLKFLILYLGIVRIAVPLLLHLPEKQASAISAAFSFSQLITAAIGGAVACIVIPILNRTIKDK